MTNEEFKMYRQVTGEVSGRFIKEAENWAIPRFSIHNVGVAIRSYNEGAEWKDRQFKEYLEENFSDIIFECVEEYKKLKGSLNDDGTLRSDYQLAQDIAITYESKIINEFFKEN